MDASRVRSVPERAEVSHDWSIGGKITFLAARRRSARRTLPMGWLPASVIRHGWLVFQDASPLQEEGGIRGVLWAHGGG